MDGVLLPGGNGDYLSFGRRIFEKVLNYNDQSNFCPMWGICLGYEFLSIYTSELGKGVLGSFDYHKVSLPLKFVNKDPQDTLLYHEMSESDIENL